MRDYVEHLRSKPEHVRRAIALSVAAGVTAIVALGWMIALVSSGTLAVSPVPLDSDLDETFAEGQERYNALAGAAAAFSSEGSGEPSVTIVEEKSESTLDRNEQPEETVIHF